MDPEVVLPTVAAIGLGFVVLPAIAITAIDARAPRSVACPADGAEARVRIDGRQALAHLFRGGPQRVCACSRWPAQAGCDRACEAQLA